MADQQYFLGPVAAWEGRPAMMAFGHNETTDHNVRRHLLSLHTYFTASIRESFTS